MPSSASFPEQGPDPLAPLVHLADGLAHFTVTVLIGLTVGIILARVLRWRHLHWTWSVSGLALVVVATRSALASITSVLGVAALSATVFGRRWHERDIALGADLATIAAGPCRSRVAAAREGRTPWWSDRRARARP